MINSSNPTTKKFTAKTQAPVRSHLVVIAAYFFLTVVMTWPAILHLRDGIPGDGFDGWQNYWNLWWVREALLELGRQPYFTPYLYPPAGTNLFFHTLNIFNGLWTLPLQLNFGLAVAYNSVVFFSFVFAGYGGYLLSLYTLSRLDLVGSKGLRLAAFTGGLIFTMSPFHMAHLLGHMQVFSMVWPPFYVLWLLRTLQPWQTTPPPYHRRNIALTALFLILATLVDWYHMLYLLLFTGLVLLWKMIGQWRTLSKQRKVYRNSEEPEETEVNFRADDEMTDFAPLLRPLWITLLIGLGFAIALSPLLIPMIREAGARPDLQTGLEQNIILSADLLAFFLPSEMHPLWGDWAKSIAANFTTTTSERLIFAGFVPLALTIYIIIRGWRRRIVKFWTLIAGLFFLLALGPFLHIGGRLITIGPWLLPLPYWLLYYTIPFIGLTRSLSRYDLMVMLALGVLTAIALASLTNDHLPLTKSQNAPFTPRTTHYALRPTSYVLRPIRSLWLPLLTIALICFEFLAIPYPISTIEIPQFYFDIAGQPETYTIAELPMNWDRPTTLLHQTIHEKPLLTAYTSRDNPRELAWRIPVFQHWRRLGPDIIDQPLADVAPTIFADFNLRYIVLDYWQMPPGSERDETEKWTAAALPNATPIYDDGRLKVYQSRSKTETRPYLSLGDGWGDRREGEDGSISRTFSTDGPAQLFLHHPQGQALILEITAAAGDGAETTYPVTLSANGAPVATVEVGPTFSSETITLPALSADLVELTFDAGDSPPVIIIKKISLREDMRHEQTTS